MIIFFSEMYGYKGHRALVYVLLSVIECLAASEVCVFSKSIFKSLARKRPLKSRNSPLLQVKVVGIDQIPTNFSLKREKNALFSIFLSLIARGSSPRTELTALFLKKSPFYVSEEKHGPLYLVFMPK